MGALYLERGRMSDAAREFQAASRIAPERPALLLFRGLAHKAANEPLEAVEAFRRAWELDPDDPVKAYLVAGHALRDNLNEKATKPLATLSAAVRRIAAQEAGQRPLRSSTYRSFRMRPPGPPLFGPAAYQQGYMIERSAYLDAVTALRSAASTDRLVTATTIPAHDARCGRLARRTNRRGHERLCRRDRGLTAGIRGASHDWRDVLGDGRGKRERRAPRERNPVEPRRERARVTLARVFAEAGQPARAQQTPEDRLSVALVGARTFSAWDAVAFLAVAIRRR